MQTWPKVAIIVLNWNGWQDTIECLESLQRLTYPNYQIIVVDNGSTDGDSVESIKAWARGEILVQSDFLMDGSSQKPIPLVEVQYDCRSHSYIGSAREISGAVSLSRSLILIAASENLGFAGGVNIGLRFVMEHDFHYVWLLNNDTVVHPEALAELVRVANHDGSIGMVGSKILFYNRPDVVQEAGVRSILGLGLFFMRGYNTLDRGQNDQTMHVEFLSGCSLLVRTALVRSVGLLDEMYFLYCEEFDWQIRAKRCGWRLVYAHKSKVWHKLGRSSGGRGNPVHAYFTTRNALVLVGRYSRSTLPLAVAVHLLRIGKRVVRGKLAEALSMSRGLWDGILLGLKAASS